MDPFQWKIRRYGTSDGSDPIPNKWRAINILSLCSFGVGICVPPGSRRSSILRYDLSRWIGLHRFQRPGFDLIYSCCQHQFSVNLHSWWTFCLLCEKGPFSKGLCAALPPAETAKGKSFLKPLLDRSWPKLPQIACFCLGEPSIPDLHHFYNFWALFRLAKAPIAFQRPQEP